MPDSSPSPSRAAPYLPPAVQPVRVLVWALHLALPLVGLWLVLTRPELDVYWHHNPSHFWLVLAGAAVSTALGLRMSVAARRHADARLTLVSLTFLTSAGFLGVHGLTTPGVLVPHASMGFDIAHPVGLVLASVLAFASATRLDPLWARRVLRWQPVFLAALAATLVAWVTLVLLDLPPLDRPPLERDVQGPFVVVAVAAVALFAAAAVRYYLMYRSSPSAVLMSVITAFTLLAETTAAVVLADKWHLSWWLWHVLLVVAYAFVAYSAYVQYQREGSSAGLFDAVTLRETARRIQAEHSAVVEELVSALERRERTGAGDTQPIARRVAERFGLTEGQSAVLARSGSALAAERRASRRLAALVAVGERARVGLAEEEFLREVLARVRDGYGDVEVGLVSDGAVRVGGRSYGDPTALAGRGPFHRDGRLVHPLTVRGRVAGVLEVRASGERVSEEDASLVTALANHLSIALENARLYRELGTLFRQYMSPDVAAALLADPGQAALGGSVVEVTALFADLRGFTTFSEEVPPGEIVTMLNRYHSVAVPCVLDNGGTIVQFVGDALLALFNAPARQPDHAALAVRAALEMQEAVERIAADRPDWPRLRVGANTGPALVGNIGSESLRGFNAMGDAVNVAARLQGLAEPGQVVVGEATVRSVAAELDLRPLGERKVKGRSRPVRAYVVAGMGEWSDARDGAAR